MRCAERYDGPSACGEGDTAPPRASAPPSSVQRLRAPSSHAPPASNDARPIDVLVVDDEELTGRAVRRILAYEHDIRVFSCLDPAAAIATAARLRPTVILQDLVMADSDGISMVRAFREDPITRDVPIVMLTNEDDPTTKAEAFAAGADDYLVKFPARPEMTARVRHHARGYLGAMERKVELAALLEAQRQLEAQSRFLRQTFGRYVTDAVVDNLLATPDGLDLGGAKRKVTVMMTDLRGFTPLAERLDPAQVVQLLNTHLEVMTEIAVRHRGTIDEFIGDAILVLFGAPEQADDDAERAVACAVEMQLAMAEVNARNLRMGLPEVQMGIGLDTGEVVVGNIGSSRRAKYGVVGSTVNLTARIQSCASGGQILISSSTLKEAGRTVVVEHEKEILPKGFARPLRVHRVAGILGGYGLLLDGAEQIK